MNESKLRYCFEPDGKLYKEHIERREITITPDVVQSMVSDLSIKLKNIAIHPMWGPTHVAVSTRDSYCWWTIDLPKLILRCPYKLIEGIMVPQLDSGEEIMPLEWIPPAGMRIRFLLCTRFRSPYAIKDGYAYMFALSEDGDTWRLPIGNLFDDCHLCLGEEHYSGTSHLECVSAVLDQFSKSEWNADLWKGDKVRKTQQLFRFKPKNEGFEQVAPTAAWSTLCYKVAVAISDKLVL